MPTRYDPWPTRLLSPLISAPGEPYEETARRISKMGFIGQLLAQKYAMAKLTEI